MKTHLSLVLTLSLAPIGVFAAEAQRTEIAAVYTYLRANAPPGECDCFSMNGGSVSVAQPFDVGSLPGGSLAGVFDASFARASHISGGGYSLNLSTFTFGLRYRPIPQTQWSPFVQVLLGVSHASGSLLEGNTPAASDAKLEFAGEAGGGIDRWIGERWSLRVLEVDYLRTTYSNRVNDYQNTLRVSVGAAYHFGLQR